MLFGKTLSIYERALDASSLRQKTIANNIANIDTPNYKTQDVSFEEELKSAMNTEESKFEGYRTDPRHFYIGNRSTIENVTPRKFTDFSTVMQNNGNNVDIEYEMTKMSENQLLYSALIDRTNSYFSKLKSVINGRG